MAASNPDLIALVAQECGCSYISDLHDRAVRAKLKRVLANDQLLSYPLGHWKSLAEYLTDKRPESDDAAVIRKYILDRI